MSQRYLLRVCFQGQSASLPAFHSAPWPKEPHSTLQKRATASSPSLAAQGCVGLSPFRYPQAGKSPLPSLCAVGPLNVAESVAGVKGGTADGQRFTVSVKAPEPGRVHRFACRAAPSPHRCDPRRDLRSWSSASPGSRSGERQSCCSPRGSSCRRLNPGCRQRCTSPLVGPLLGALLPAWGDDVPARSPGGGKACARGF